MLIKGDAQYLPAKFFSEKTLYFGGYGILKTGYVVVDTEIIYVHIVIGIND